jgi:hypothetical protein
MNTPRKLQSLLIRQLLTKGTIQLLLPDGVTLEIGITQEDQFGETCKTDGYCYVVAKRDGRSIMLDSYNLGLQYGDEENTIVYEDEAVSDDGQLFHSLDIV